MRPLQSLNRPSLRGHADRPARHPHAKIQTFDNCVCIRGPGKSHRRMPSFTCHTVLRPLQGKKSFCLGNTHDRGTRHRENVSQSTDDPLRKTSLSAVSLTLDVAATQPCVWLHRSMTWGSATPGKNLPWPMWPPQPDLGVCACLR